MIEHQDLAPEDWASRCESSISRASHAARRAAAEVRSRVARQRAAKEFPMAVLRQEIAVLEAETEENALKAGDEAFKRVLRNTVTPGRRLSVASQRVEPSLVSWQWRKSKPASQQWETSYPVYQQWERPYPAAQQRQATYPASRQWERPYPASQQRERLYLAPQQWKEELSLASHGDPQATTQHDQGTVRPDPSARVRTVAELPPQFP